jgi:hypothetical protein
LTYTDEQKVMDVEDINAWKRQYIRTVLRAHPEITNEELLEKLEKAKKEHFKPLAKKIWTEMHTE